MTPGEHDRARFNGAFAHSLVYLAREFDLEALHDSLKDWTGRGHMPSSLPPSRGPSTFSDADTKASALRGLHTSASGSSDAAPLPGRSVPSETGQPAPPSGCPVVY